MNDSQAQQSVSVAGEADVTVPSPLHSVSVAGVVVRADGRVLAIRRADNGAWDPQAHQAHGLVDGRSPGSRVGGRTLLADLAARVDRRQARRSRSRTSSVPRHLARCRGDAETRTGDINYVGKKYSSDADPEAVTADQVAGLPESLGIDRAESHRRVRGQGSPEAVCARDADKLGCPSRVSSTWPRATRTPSAGSTTLRKTDHEDRQGSRRRRSGSRIPRLAPPRSLGEAELIGPYLLSIRLDNYPQAEVN